MPFPSLDPVFFTIGPLEIRWYALAYLAGFILGLWMCKVLARRFARFYKAKMRPQPDDFELFLSWAVIGTLLGGRLGYVLFYQFDYYAAHPLEILKLWHGGMSFHGGLLGVIAAAFGFTRVHKRSFWAFTDILACVAPIGLFLGRMANFVNGELWGRASDMPWAVVFPHGGDIPRHPSQLYEAGLEGLLLFIVMMVLCRLRWVPNRPGFLSGVFLAVYAIARFVLEFFREPDAQLGFLFGGMTMGQLLCLPMLLCGLYLIGWSLMRYRRKKQGKKKEGLYAGT